MSGSSRREFLGRAVLAGAGATVVQRFASAAAAPEARPPTFTDRPDPNFLIGRVVAATSDGGLKVLTPDDELRTAWLGSGSRYWKGGAWNETVITGRDCVMGRGEINADGALSIDRLWANIMKIDGSVEVIDRQSGEIKVRASDKRVYRLGVTDRTLGVDRRDRQRIGDPDVVAVGEPMFAIAYQDSRTGRLFAHRLESGLADRDAPSPSETEPSAAPKTAVARSARVRPHAHTAISVNLRGNASYFCCNTSGGCSCGSAPAGFCSGCHSASWQIAWPKITGCTASCVGCCLPSDFPR